MAADPDYRELFRHLVPMSHLPAAAQDALIASACTLVEFRAGEQIHVQGEEDPFFSYLLSGRVERSIDGQVLDILDADREPRKRPLDDRACKRDSVRALSSVSILRVGRVALERACQEADNVLEGGGTLEVLEIDADTSTDWQTRLLRSHAFLRLSAEAIQRIFDRMEEVEVGEGEEVIRQGDAGDYYYVVQSGLCKVVRKPTARGQEVHLADVGPGEGVGEEALISGAPRNASVRMVRAGTVMRLSKSDFLDLVVTPLVQGVSPSQGRWLVEQGGNWVEVRDGRTGNGRSHAFDEAIRLPLHLLRLQSRRLDRARTYVLCGENVDECRLAAFLLVERGFEVAYLEQPLSRAILEIKPMTETRKDAGSSPAAQEPAPRDMFGETTTSAELAALIDEVTRQRDALGESDSPAGDGATAEVQPAPPAPPDSTRADVPEPAERVVDLDPQAIVGELLRDVGREMGRYVTDCLDRQRSVLEQKLAQRLERIERAARDRIEAHERQLQARYAGSLREKERELAAAYDKLASLANRIGQQKADIQKRRKALAEMLRTASRVHQEVFRVGNALVDQVDHLDDLPTVAQGEPTAH